MYCTLENQSQISSHNKLIDLCLRIMQWQGYSIEVGTFVRKESLYCMCIWPYSGLIYEM